MLLLAKAVSLLRFASPFVSKFHHDSVAPLPKSCITARGFASRIVFVGGMVSNVKEEDIRRAFKSCGAINEVRLAVHPKTKHGKGFGFVEFETVEEAETAIKEMNGKIIKGRTIKVASATPSANKGKDEE